MKKPLLALSTSSNACSVTLATEQAYFVRHEIAPNQHTQLILEMIDSVLKEAKFSKTQLGAIAIDEGPGSFTGLRIGLGVAQGLAFGLELPLYPISSFASLVLESNALKPEWKHLPAYCALDARMQEVYFAIYQKVETQLQILQKPCLIPAEKLQDFASEKRIVALGSPWETVQSERKITTLFPHSKFIAQQALAQIKRGDQGQGVNTVQPIYIRDNVAVKSLKSLNICS